MPWKTHMVWLKVYRAEVQTCCSQSLLTSLISVVGLNSLTVLWRWKKIRKSEEPCEVDKRITWILSPRESQIWEYDFPLSVCSLGAWEANWGIDLNRRVVIHRSETGESFTGVGNGNELGVADWLGFGGYCSQQITGATSEDFPLDSVSSVRGTQVTVCVCRAEADVFSATWASPRKAGLQLRT